MSSEIEPACECGRPDKGFVLCPLHGDPDAIAAAESNRELPALSEGRVVRDRPARGKSLKSKTGRG